MNIPAHLFQLGIRHGRSKQGPLPAHSSSSSRSFFFSSFLPSRALTVAGLRSPRPATTRELPTQHCLPLAPSPDLHTPDLCSRPRPPLARDDPAASRGGRGEMLRLRAFRPTSDKVVKIQLHPTHPWLVTADANDRVSVWDWEHRQVQLASSARPI